MGPLAIALLQPVGLRLFHLFLANLLWIGVVVVAAERAVGQEPAPAVREVVGTVRVPW